MSVQAKPLVDLHERVWTNTAETEKQLDAELAELTDNQQIATVQRQRNIAGFRVVESKEETDQEQDLRAQRLGERRSASRSAREKASAFRTELGRNGIKAFAVLPEKIWDALCDEGKLFRFESIDSEGKVRCENPFAGLSDMISIALTQIVGTGIVAFFAGGISLMQALGAVACFAASLAFVRYMETSRNDWPVWVMMGAVFLTFASPEALVCATASEQSLVDRLLVFAIASFLGTVITVLVWIHAPEQILKQSAQPLFAMLLKVMPKSVVHDKLWPDRIDVENDATENTTATTRVAIRFPDPPEDVATVLRTAEGAGYHLCVTAVSDAIYVDSRDFADAFVEELQRDPIVYIKKDGLVAVIAQFGDFPVEEQVMKKIGSIDFLPQM